MALWYAVVATTRSPLACNYPLNDSHRPLHVRFGWSSTDLATPKSDFLFSPESGLKPDTGSCLFRAKTRLGFAL
jgi:hypothetical protein